MPTPAQKRRARYVSLAAGALAIVAAGVVIAPFRMVARGTEQAIDCLARYRAPRGPEHPDCHEAVAPFVWPSRIPWTSHVASYRAEELFARMVEYDYLDAAVGKPDRAALAKAAVALEDQGEAMKKQSQRVVVEELGPAIGAPDLGRDADEAGDRATMIHRANEWLEWHVRLHALEDVILEGGVAAAKPVIEHYAYWDPRNEDLRSVMAALFCELGQEPRGLDFAKFIQSDRAGERHENFTRDYGDTRWLMTACAAHGGLKDVPKPDKVDAGKLSQAEARHVLELKILSEKGESDPAPLYEAAKHALDLLSSTRTPGARAMLITAVAATGYSSLDVDVVARAATPPDDTEAPLVGSAPITALDWLHEERGAAPVLPGALAQKGAEQLTALVKSGDPTKAKAIEAVKIASAAAWLVAARAYAREGKPEASAAAIDHAADGIPNASARALARSSAFDLGGDRERALAELDGVHDDASPAVKAAAAIQRAELLASKGDQQGAAKAAIAADELARAAHDRGIDLRARWTRLALAPSSPLRDGDEAAAARASDRAARYIPWLSPAEAPENVWPTPVEVGDTRVPRAMFAWSTERKASPEERRAFRYAVLKHRGDIPLAYPAFVTIVGDMLGDGEGDRSLWLDAATAFDPSLMTLREYAWGRAEAARWRGDAKEALVWQRRFESLRDYVADPKNAELARAIGL